MTLWTAKWIWERFISRFFLKSQLWIVNYYGKSSSTNLSNEIIKTGVSREMVFQKQLILAFQFMFLSWKQQKHQWLCFHYWDYLANFWCNNWRSIIDIVEGFSYIFFKFSKATQQFVCLFTCFIRVAKIVANLKLFKKRQNKKQVKKVNKTNFTYKTIFSPLTKRINLHCRTLDILKKI